MSTDLVFLLGDQLTLDYGALCAVEQKNSIVVMAEVGDETTYTWHHKQKLIFVLSAMRHFAQELREAGWQVDYVELNDKGNTSSLDGEIKRAIERHAPEKVHLNEAAEYRVRQIQDEVTKNLDCPSEIHSDTRFIATRDEFKTWAEGRKSLTMEYFYRAMRQKTGLLMSREGKPVGGQWNFDADNRKPAKSDLFMPARFAVDPDDITRDVMTMVAQKFADNPGNGDSFIYAVTRAQAEDALDHFLEHCLARFGDYQDAMLSQEPFLYHSLLSAYMNVGLLDPRQVCEKAETAYKQGNAPLNAVEGFIRQIIGWREYVRGVYWQFMPEYRSRNALNAKRQLPDFYWTGDTKMNCLSRAISQTLEHAYAHHIQRLMITGNYALMAGIDPFAVHEWYLAIYIDAFEWVELPNTIGMSQFADGGLLGSKPYAASANYINKMSDYCAGCAYDPKQRMGEKACPFNALYWDFIIRHKETFKSNNRMKRIYAVWDRMDEGDQHAIRQTAAHHLAELDQRAK